MKSLKLLSLILCVALLCVLTVACGEDNPTGSGSKNPVDSSVETVTSDKSGSDTASADTPSNDTVSSNTQSTISNDSSSSSGATGSQAVSSSVDASSEQSSTESTPDDSTALTVCVDSRQDGNTVIAEIKIINNPGLTAFNFALQYNKDALKPTKITKGLVSVTSNLQQNQNLSGNVTLLYVDATGFSDNGTLATVTFDMKDSSKPFDLGLSANNNSFLKLDGKTYVVDFVVK